jgi:ubiquinone/menaquinone biosynthesis C-methylase UbiE
MRPESHSNPEEVAARRSGFDVPLPAALEGCRVLDLGSGAGADCIVLAERVGREGEVIGLDRSPEQIALATRAAAKIPNLRFIEGRMEEIPLESGAIQVILSNHALHGSAQKERVLAEAWRVLAPGGELSIAVLVADRRWPDPIDPPLLDTIEKEKLGGVPYAGDLIRLLKKAGFLDVRSVSSEPHPMRGLGELRLRVLHLRSWKLPLEDGAEDYGQVAVYNGTIADAPGALLLDRDHRFDAGRVLRVSKNTADVILGSRFARHFTVSPPVSHLGAFGAAPPSDAEISAERESIGTDTDYAGFLPGELELDA